MKTLSIAIPVYNTEDYIRRCLDSVLVQEALPYIELIIVNDGSKDSSPEIIREYQARFPENIVFIDKENGGHGSTINAALKAATGKYFRVLDSDDWFDTPEFIKYLKALSACDEDLIVTPYTQEYVYNGTVVPYNYEFFTHDQVYSVDELVFDETKTYYTMASSTYKLEILHKSGLKLFEKSFYVDMQYNIYPIPYLKTVHFLDYHVYRYFMGRPNQSMSQENLLRNLPNHQNVLSFLIEYYVSFREKVSKNVKEYMSLLIYFMFYTHMDLVCNKLKDRRLAYRTIKDFDTYLKNTAPDLYRMVDVFPYIHFSRRLRYINVRFFNSFFTKLLVFARKVRGKLKRS